MIYWILIILFVLYKIIFGNIVFGERDVEEIDKFIYALLYRGYAEEGVGGNTELSVNIVNIRLTLIKHKEKGEIGIYLYLRKEDISEEQ